MCLEPVDSDVVVKLRGWGGEEMMVMRIGTNQWHLDPGLKFSGVVGRRGACDGQAAGSVSAWRLRIRGVVGLVSVLARVCARENGASVSPLGEWRRVDSKDTG